MKIGINAQITEWVMIILFELSGESEWLVALKMEPQISGPTVLDGRIKNIKLKLQNT